MQMALYAVERVVSSRQQAKQRIVTKQVLIAAVQISRFCIPIAHALKYYNKQSKQYHSLSSLDGTCVPEIHGFG